MPKIKNLYSSILEGIVYGISGGVFIVAVLEIQEFLAKADSNDFGFSSSPKQSIGLAWLFLGLSVCTVLGNLFFGKVTKSLFAKWFFIVITSSVTTVLMQMGFLVYYSGKTFNEIIHDNLLGLVGEILGLWWMIKIFMILTPFTFLFVNRYLLIEKFQNRNELK